MSVRSEVITSAWITIDAPTAAVSRLSTTRLSLASKTSVARVTEYTFDRLTVP
jgi:hypothetical protein